MPVTPYCELAGGAGTFYSENWNQWGSVHVRIRIQIRQQLWSNNVVRLSSVGRLVALAAMAVATAAWWTVFGQRALVLANSLLVVLTLWVTIPNRTRNECDRIV